MSRCCSSMPSPRRSRASATTASAALLSGSSVVICEPMCTCAPTGSRPAPRRHLAKQRRRFVDRHAELVRLEAGRNVRVALRVDVGIDAQRDARPRALRDGALIDAIELARRLDVDRQQAQRDGAIDLGGALADAGEHDLIGAEPAAHRDVHFAERVRVGMAAERLQQADDRERRIGLERVMDGVRVAVERLVERGVGGADRAGVVDVARRAGGRGDVAQLRGAGLWSCRGSGGGHSLNSNVNWARDPRFAAIRGRNGRGRDGMISGRGRTAPASLRHA